MIPFLRSTSVLPTAWGSPWQVRVLTFGLSDVFVFGLAFCFPHLRVGVLFPQSDYAPSLAKSGRGRLALCSCCWFLCGVSVLPFMTFPRGWIHSTRPCGRPRARRVRVVVLRWETIFGTPVCCVCAGVDQSPGCHCVHVPSATRNARGVRRSDGQGKPVGTIEALQAVWLGVQAVERVKGRRRSHGTFAICDGALSTFRSSAVSTLSCPWLLLPLSFPGAGMLVLM